VGKHSAGILLFRRRPASVEFLAGHPGGPYWARKDLGAWTLPKGHIEAGEAPADAARREFAEETGGVVSGPLHDLGDVRLRSGKRIRGFLVEGDFDPNALQSILQSIEWPPRSGLQRAFPELDRVAWFTADEARRRLHPAQALFIDRALAILDQTETPS
jgi:predicted NUDIX family NTP pyrophosphohydrolase